MAHLLASYGNLENPVDAVLDNYFNQCALELCCEDLAKASLFLARHGVSAGGTPFLTPNQSKRVNAVMLTCGTYDAAGEFAYRVGLPGKSGVGGGIVAIVPGRCSITVWGPALGPNGNSVAGIAALDTVYSDVNNEEGFIAEATLIKKLGFDGKSVINPRQIEPLHQVFMPSEKDLNKARAIMDAIAEANARGSGVASLKGKMIDKPVVTRAKRLLDLYEAGSKIDEVEEI